jgi:hypothetical protein
MIDILALRRGLAYEGDIHTLRAIHPTPVFTRARCDKIQDFEHNQFSNNLFREDSFDPITRIRRGRLYQLDGSQPGSSYPPENVHNYPFGPHSGVAGGWYPDCKYRPIYTSDFGAGGRLEGLLFRLGDNDFETLWRVVSVEKIISRSNGHLLFTLRPMSSWGAVPVLNNEIVDSDGSTVDPAPIKAALDKVVTALHLQQPVSTVDACREAARVVLAAWLGSKAVTKDLNDVIKGIPDDRTMIKTLRISSSNFIRALNRPSTKNRRRGEITSVIWLMKTLIRACISSDYCSARSAGPHHETLSQI